MESLYCRFHISQSSSASRDSSSVITGLNCGALVLLTGGSTILPLSPITWLQSYIQVKWWNLRGLWMKMWLKSLKARLLLYPKQRNVQVYACKSTSSDVFYCLNLLNISASARGQGYNFKFVSCQPTSMISSMRKIWEKYIKEVGITERIG